MSLNQGKSKDFNISGNLQPGINKSPDGKYKIIIVSKNNQIHQSLVQTLQNFSLNGKGIYVFCVSSLQDAQVVAEQNPQIILVVIDNNVQVNGSYKVFEEFIRNELGNKSCCITFKDNLLNNSSCKDIFDKDDNNQNEQFYYARERLVDITRMIMITTEMEETVSTSQKIDSKYDSEIIQDFEEKEYYTKDKLYNVLAHDLKEPVGNIKVMLDFLTNEPDLLDQETSKDLLQRVRESANNIHDMLEDFTFWSRMFKQDVYFNPRRVEMGQVVRENIILLKSTAAAKNIKLSMNIPENTMAFADEYMITTVIRNLLYNSIKFTGTGGDITVTANTSDGVVEINVEDNGIGIPEEDLEKLFKVDVYFSTAGTKEETGAGLGLVLCKDFIERNGGKIIVKSTEECGSTFSFTLPCWNFN